MSLRSIHELPDKIESTVDRPCRVLVADDELVNREILTRMLARNGYASSSVDSGLALLHKLDVESFDLILLDVMMPEMDGFECLRRIRERFPIGELPVIMVTAEVERERIVSAFRAGANDYVTKPIDREITLARIETHTQLRRTLSALRDSEERYALAARGANDGLWDWDLVQNKVFYSPRWKSMLGFRDEEVGASPNEWSERIHADDRDKVLRFANPDYSGADTNLECEIRMIHRDGGYRWMLCRGVYVRSENGKICRMAGSLTDITEGKVGDPLTGLPNRLLFVDRLERTIERYQRNKQALFAVMFLDLDNFKLINDSLGHQAGDRLLITIAERLETCLRASDSVCRLENGATVARHAGDEFTILLEELKSPNDVTPIADRILRAISRPVQLDSQEIVPTLSIGWAVADDNVGSAEDILREADTAMYQAKSDGRNCSRRFESGMHHRAKLRLELEKDLRHGLVNNEFFLNYQPIICLESSRTIGFEALVRWRHPQRGWISPLEFIPTAEEMGLIIPLGWWITEQACRQAAAWDAQFPDQNLFMTINCTVKQMYQPNCLEQFREIFERTGVAPQQICMEVTESTLMDRHELIRPIVVGLRDQGVRIGIDDFGTGYSSLSFLHRFPLDLLKIDRSFVSSMLSSNENREIVRTIIDLGRNLKLKIVAEGVEDEMQRAMLWSLGCEMAQGYLWSPPVVAARAAQFLAAPILPSCALPTTPSDTISLRE